MARNTFYRSLHDLGLAAWFGGTLANAVALNPAAAKASYASDRGSVVNTGWDKWTPVNAGAIGLHLAGGAGLLLANKGRLAGQKGVGAMTVTKTALTGAALGVTAYSRLLGREVSQQTDVPVDAGTEPNAQTPEKVAKAQQQLKVLQWAVPALTGTLVILGALAGEQQRGAEVAKGVRARVLHQLAHRD
jgi:hypothetical protein